MDDTLRSSYDLSVEAYPEPMWDGGDLWRKKFPDEDEFSGIRPVMTETAEKATHGTDTHSLSSV